VLSRANGSKVDFIENILGSKLITRGRRPLGECLVQLSCYLKRVQRRKEKPDQTQNTRQGTSPFKMHNNVFHDIGSHDLNLTTTVKQKS
jgi:hypothetical protein